LCHKEYIVCISYRFSFDDRHPTESYVSSFSYGSWGGGVGGGANETTSKQMTHLRVPGRITNVPQTIIEEDIPSYPCTPPTESFFLFGSPGVEGLVDGANSSPEDTSPSSTPPRRRKNASSWIAPPVFGVLLVGSL